MASVQCAIYVLLSSTCLLRSLATQPLGLALIYFLSQTGEHSPYWTRGDGLIRLFIIADVISTTLPFALSVVYHTFMPHFSGVSIYKGLLKTDVFGVWFSATFSPICSSYVTLYCFPSLLYSYLAIYLLLSLAVLYYLVIVDCKRKRVQALTVQFIFRATVQLLRLNPSISTVPLSAFVYYFIAYVLSAVGALINALHVPERWFPGQCDYVVNGHSLMHVVAVLSLGIGKYGVYTDLNWLVNQPSCPL